MRPHRNTGARFVRPSDGETWEHGAVKVPTPRELRMRRHKLVPVAMFDVPDDVRAEAEGPAGRFPGVDFASDVAYERARDGGLRAEDFEGRTGTGQDGAFKAGDVDAMLDGQDG